MNEKNIPNITSLLIKEGVSIYGISTINKSLEEVFTEILEKRKSQGKIK